MPTINFKNREVSCKIVYYGPSLSGKTTNICCIHEKAPSESRTALQCVDTRGDRTLFFDHFALDLGQVGEMRTKFQVYGVPGQVFYRATRKVVLNGADGIVFVADSARDRLKENLESLEDMRQILIEHKYDPLTIPTVMQYNKRDLDDAMGVADLEEALNKRSWKSFEAIATQGVGVIETFKSVCKAVVESIESRSGTRGRRVPGPGTARKS